MTEQTFTNRHGTQLTVQPDDSEVPGSVVLDIDGEGITLEPGMVAQLALVLAPVVVGPDDHLVLKLDGSMDAETVHEMGESLVKTMPGLAGRVLIIGGGAEVFVVRPGDEVLPMKGTHTEQNQSLSGTEQSAPPKGI